jgi:hypothetical protein
MECADSSPPELRPTSRVGRKNFIAADVGNKHVLMNVDKGTYIGLDAVGKSIWQHLEEPQTIANLCDQLRAAYQVPEQALFERDVIEFIANLRLQGLVEIIP